MTWRTSTRKTAAKRRRGAWDLDYIPVLILARRPSRRWQFNEVLVAPVHGGRVRWVSCISVGEPVKLLVVR